MLFNVPEKCKDCCNISPLYYDSYICSLSCIHSSNPEADISTVKVNPESRPEWCPMVKVNTEYDAMDPKKKEYVNMIYKGLSGLFGLGKGDFDD